MDLSYTTKIFKNYNGYKSTNHKVFVTKNMAIFLHYLLKSISFTEQGDLLLLPTKNDAKILSQFCAYDVVDCYERLHLQPDTFGTGLCDVSKKYVFDKLVNINSQKRRAKNE
ncbi:MAG: hypothetical protein PWP52_1645 [Bacteroidales bacterium]|nr:hypothetical protein [Bacteroidales bacterium]MDN5355785.1 hypothetical protein [Rikenellaceae bacterium]